MKKIVALFLALALVLSMTVAMAEVRQFVMVAVSDLEGNTIDATETDEFPVLVLQLDDENMTCAFGTEEELAAATLEVVEEIENGVVLLATFEDGSTITMQYIGADDTVYIIDEANGYVYGLMNIEVLAELEAA